MDDFVIEQNQAAMVNQDVLGAVIAVHQGDAEGQRFADQGVHKIRRSRGLLGGISTTRFQAQRFEEGAIAEYFRQIRAAMGIAVNGRKQSGELADMAGRDLAGEQQPPKSRE